MDYEIIVGHKRLDLDVIHAFLRESYWSPGIPRVVVERAVRNSICAGAYHDGAQVGFARVVSDCATFAYLADVFVLSGDRGRGLARRMTAAFLVLPELQGLRRWSLVTRDAHGVYAPLGFVPVANPDRHMEILRTDVYVAR